MARARNSADAAADATGERAGDPTDQCEVVTRSHRRIEIDHLDLRELRETTHPSEHIGVTNREALALDQLNHGAVLQID